jgi:chemotaxis protein MotB
MRRRHLKHLAHRENIDRWLVSYADYMTLMFALFVVLYAMAIVNKDKHPLLLDTLEQAVEQLTQHKKTVPSLDALPYRPEGVFDAQGTLPLLLPMADRVAQSHDGALEYTQTEGNLDSAQLSAPGTPHLGTPLDVVAAQLNLVLEGAIKDQEAHVQIEDDWVTVELNAQQMFPGGSATLLNDSKQQLIQIAKALGKVDNYIRVRGYTDDLSVNNEIFDSNWELSVARATRVLRFLEVQGVQSPRLAVEGYGQYTPAKPNKTDLDRQANRRVVIALSRFGWQAPQVDKLDPSLPIESPEATQETGSKADSKTILTIPLEGGGVRYTTRQE